MILQMSWDSEARTIWKETIQITRQRGLYYVDSYQLFLAILCEQGVVTRAIERVIFESRGFFLIDLHGLIGQYAGKGRATLYEGNEISPELEAIIMGAMCVAAVDGLIQAGPEHLMWAIFNQKGSLAKILAECGLEPSSFDYAKRILENRHG